MSDAADTPVDELFLYGAETHSVGRIEAALARGLDPNGKLRHNTPLEWLIEMYPRTPRFSECVRELVDAGAECDDPTLLAVLLDDVEMLRARIVADPERLETPVSLTSAYTSLTGATLLHVAAEFGLVGAARTLLELGADVDARTAVDEHGLDGQTPIFHTVCSNLNHGQAVLRLLLEHGADTEVRLAGLVWGRCFPWETVVFEPTLLSYAQAGLYPQFHRREEDVYANIALVLEATGRVMPPLVNVPNEYVHGKRPGQ